MEGANISKCLIKSEKLSTYGEDSLVEKVSMNTGKSCLEVGPNVAERSLPAWALIDTTCKLTTNVCVT